MDWESFAAGADAPPPSSQHIDGPRADRLPWEAALGASDALRALTQARPDWPAWDALLQDVFLSYYKLDPQLRPEDAVDPRSAANRPVVEQLLAEPATAATRAQHALDELAAALATLAAGRALADTLEPPPAPGRDPADAPPPPNPGALAKAARRAAQAGAEAAWDLQATLVSWGLDPADLGRLPLGDRLRLVERLRQPDLRRLAEGIGRLRRLARTAQRQALRHRRDEWTAITQGADLARVLPVELAALADPVRAWDVGRRLVEGRLLQYDVRPTPRAGRGPILCAVDCSGSMAGIPLEWAVAVALALADTARRQRRDFAACAFNAKLQGQWDAPRGRFAPDGLLGLAQLGADGGTAFEPPLQWALDRLAQHRFRQADVVLITDGECRLAAAFRDRLLQAKARLGFRVFAIQIGGTDDELSHWADRIWRLDGAPDDGAAAALFTELVPA